ncbi:ketoglutarate semialdehyde dehydrogenase [Ktedonobacter sp. SOSP1-52]|uniref:aldehyde dehydrogenase (NADP(+)) n=1 Tax=Ktedonobacter sp. SOSP1-52 TaxID=2778366 RepID=UPI001914FF70|nr:aldehyde dehydrogenase (NADP(+)) [Ktedonobacter sp. SOSP1-52]GHO67728.1 ketoglutarate semialdehyde dehydrogenase [Ktedonobacter sp. SOSP1-52]
MSSTQPVFIAGQWREAHNPVGHFQAVDPSTGQALEGSYPISGKEDVYETIMAAHQAAEVLSSTSPEQIAAFLEQFAELIEVNRVALVEIAHRETGLPKEPRLNSNELPRTSNQLRLGAQAAHEGSWTNPVIDTKRNIRSYHAPLGAPVVVFGPNNFPFAFNAVAGGDFTAALVARNPVIAKANPGHPGTTRLLAELTSQALQSVGLPAGTFQLLYHFPNELALELVSHPLIGATGFTGSRPAGLALKAAADRAGKPIYLELSSVNPIFILPGALEERLEALANEFATSCLMGTGQFCTNPGLVVLPGGPQSETFVQRVAALFQEKAPGVLLNERTSSGLQESLKALTAHGAELLTGGTPVEGQGFRFNNTLLRVSGEQFLRESEALQTEVFGPASLFVVVENEQQMVEIARHLEGNLTGAIYSHTGSVDETLYQSLEPVLRQRVGRLLNDKMPTGVEVSPAMQHGGPFPSTGHAGFTSVGIPASISRFTVLQSYDNVRPSRLPHELQDENPTHAWRVIDGAWTRDAIAAPQHA